MFFSGTYNYIVITFLKLSGDRDHPCCMTETPLEGADQYIMILIQGQPDTLVLIPSLLTIWAIRLSSASGTFSSRPPSGVSLEIV